MLLTLALLPISSSAWDRPGQAPARGNRYSLVRFDLGAGLFRGTVNQSNYASDFSELSVAADFAIHLYPDEQLSFRAHGFASLFGLSRSLDPPAPESRDVATYSFDLFAHYRLLKTERFHAAIFGGLLYYRMVVRSDKFGFGSVISGPLGLSARVRILPGVTTELEFQAASLNDGVSIPFLLKRKRSHYGLKFTVRRQDGWLGESLFSLQYTDYQFVNDESVSTRANYLALLYGRSF